MSKQYSPVFESLTRVATPYGGNVLAGAYEQSRTRMYLSQTEIREQVDRLTREITRLNAQVSPTNAYARSVDKPKATPHDTQGIGIDRFRQENPTTPTA